MLNIFGVVIFLRTGWMVVCISSSNYYLLTDTYRFYPILCQMILLINGEPLGKYMQRLGWVLLHAIILFAFLLFVILQGYAGIWFSLLIIVLTLLVALAPALSAIGICERTHVESGGVYFLLAHVLGQRSGGTVGILYSFGMVSLESG